MFVMLTVSPKVRTRGSRLSRYVDSQLAGIFPLSGLPSLSFFLAPVSDQHCSESIRHFGRINARGESTYNHIDSAINRQEVCSLDVASFVFLLKIHTEGDIRR